MINPIEILKDKEKIVKRKKLIFCLTLIILIGIISLFFIGFHNSDLGQNLDLINCEQGTNYKDVMNDFSIVEPTELYIMGNNFMQISFLLGLIFSFSLGYQFR